MYLLSRSGVFQSGVVKKNKIMIFFYMELCAAFAVANDSMGPSGQGYEHWRLPSSRFMEGSVLPRPESPTPANFLASNTVRLRAAAAAKAQRVADGVPPVVSSGVPS